MKIKKILLTLILSVLWCGVLFSQNIVKDTSNVKRPIVGKLYYQKTDNNLYLFRNGFELVDLYPENVIVPPDTSIVNPPIGEKEYIVGFWDVPNRILVSKLINGKHYLMQRDNLSSYHVARGKNLLSDSRTQIAASEAILKGIVSENSGLGGLEKPNNFPEADFLAMGYYKNANGEYVTNGTTPPDPIIPSDKIKIPVGLIMWDNWEHDYWNDANPKYDYLINHISRNRYSATYWGDKFNLVPFYGQHIPMEKVMIRYNVKWNPELGRNTYDSLEKMVNVKFDKNQADTEREVKYYRDAGLDFMCFNYYLDGSYLSETRKDFVSMSNKMGMKMTIMNPPINNPAEVDYITTLMTKDYWLHIDGKPVLYLGGGDFVDLPKYKAALKAKNGKDIYAVYFDFNGYPADWNDYLKKGNNAVSAYNTSIGAYATQEQQIAKEVADRNNWIGQFNATHVSIIPVLSVGIENLDKRTDLKGDGKPFGIIESANVEQIGRKLVYLKDFIKKYPTKVPAVLWYAGNEILESGNPIVPTKRKDGSINTSVLDAISKHLE